MSIRAPVSVRALAPIGALALMSALAAAGGSGEPGAASGPASTQPVSTQPALQAPDAASFRAYDRPSDAGTTIGVEWARSPSEGKGVYYVLEVASKDDYEAGKFKEIRIPSLASLKSDHPEYYGYSQSLSRLHYVNVRPAKYYPPRRRPIEPRETAEVSAPQAPPTSRAAATRPAGATQPTTGPQTSAASKPAPSPKGGPDEGVKPVDPWEQGRVAYLQKREAKRLRAERRRIAGQVYYFRLAITDGRQKVYVREQGRPKTVTGRASANLFKHYKLNNLVFSVIFGCIVLGFIRAARRNPNLFIRKIAGLEAVEEAIGRATEMGRSAFFVHGLDPMSSLSTIAAVNILGRMARRAAEYDTRIRVMNCNPIVMAVSQEVVNQAYTEAGRPDAYNADDVSLVAYDQFSYVAAVGGRVVREQPAAIFLMGYFYAESLLLAETGASTGAIQIAGTDAYTQLPFFVTTCDYTLMGEELYAASAYLSREPRLLGSLRGQDVGKAFLMLIFIVGTLLATFGLHWVTDIFRAF